MSLTVVLWWVLNVIPVFSTDLLLQKGTSRSKAWGQNEVLPRRFHCSCTVRAISGYLFLFAQKMARAGAQYTRGRKPIDLDIPVDWWWHHIFIVFQDTGWPFSSTAWKSCGSYFGWRVNYAERREFFTCIYYKYGFFSVVESKLIKYT